MNVIGITPEWEMPFSDSIRQLGDTGKTIVYAIALLIAFFSTDLVLFGGRISGLDSILVW